MEALDEEIKRIEEDEEDDKAMGQGTPEKLAANKEVSFHTVIVIKTKWMSTKFYFIAQDNIYLARPSSRFSYITQILP